MNLKESLLGKIYVDQNKVMGVDVDDKQVKDKIYNQYLDDFNEGVYNYIREDIHPQTQKIIPRKYFSGGFEVSDISLQAASPAETYKVGTTTKGLLRESIYLDVRRKDPLEASSSSQDVDTEPSKEIIFKLYSSLTDEGKKIVKETVIHWTTVDDEGKEVSIFFNDDGHLHWDPHESAEGSLAYILSKASGSGKVIDTSRDALLAFRRGDPVGVVGFQAMNLSGISGIVLEKGTYVCVSERGYSLGSKLILSLLDYLKSTSHKSLYIKFDQNDRAQGLAIGVKRLLGPILGSDDILMDFEGNIVSIEAFIDKHMERGFYKNGITIAQNATAPLEKVKGGIDLNPNSLNIEIKSSTGQGIDYNTTIDSQLLEELTSSPIGGFEPVIFNITPITNLPLILGINTNSNK